MMSRTRGSDAHWCSGMSPTTHALTALPELYGGPEVLERARRRLPKVPEIRRALADHADQVLRQVGENLMTSIFGEEPHDALDRMTGAGGMQGSQAQVAGFGVVQGVLHGVEVTDLAEHDHVRRLAQHVAQGHPQGQRHFPPARCRLRSEKVSAGSAPSNSASR